MIPIIFGSVALGHLTYQQILGYPTEHFTIEYEGDEITVFRFNIDEDGYVSDINQDDHKFISTNLYRPNRPTRYQAVPGLP